MERIISGIYTTPNNYGSLTDAINEYINILYASSINLYEQIYVTNPTGTFDIDISKIEDSLGYIDDYLFYYYQFHYEDFPDIAMTLIQKLQYVTVFPPRKRGLFGEYVDEEKTLYINPQLSSSSTLTNDERTRLYICHELGHIQNSKWMKRVESIVGRLNTSYDKQLLYDGFSLLDEATTQDRAETIAYYYSAKLRPLRSRRVSQMFSGRPFETNFDYYGELQVPSIRFARTLRGIGKINNDELAMRQLDQRALKEDFADIIFEEYKLDNQINNLYDLLYNLGRIKNASYAVFGLAPKKYLNESKEALIEYNNLVVRMRDYRDPRTNNIRF